MRVSEVSLRVVIIRLHIQLLVDRFELKREESAHGESYDVEQYEEAKRQSCCAVEFLNN